MKTTINVVKRKLVKPCTPTPPNLKNYKLSFIDGLLPQSEVGVLFFYQNQYSDELLERSLEKALVQFYPLAGRYSMEDQTVVDCSDQGVEFIQAEAPQVDLARLLQERNLENLYGFLPRTKHQVEVANYPILSIQITKLAEGCGLVIGVSISHRIFDACSLMTFLFAWSNASNPRTAVIPTFDSASMFPAPGKNRPCTQTQVHCFDTNAFTVKKFTFSKESIGRLKSSLRANERVSSVRAVCGVIAKGMVAMDRAKHGRWRDVLINQALNMRERTIPPLHKHSCGNLVLLSISRSKIIGIGIQQLVDLISDATRKSIADCGEVLSLDEDGRNEVIMAPLKAASKAFISGETNMMSFSDYSKFGFYETDFGWGKPVWTSIGPQPGMQMTVLMRNKQGDGIEAWVHLEKNDMRLFEEDEDIRLFAN